MTAYLVLFGLCIVFFELFIRSNVVGDAMRILAASRDAMRVMRSPGLSDDEKEAHVRSGSLSIMKATLRMTGKLVAIGALLYLLYRIVAIVLPATGRVIPAMLIEPVPIVVLTAVTLGYAWVRARVVDRS